MQACEKVGWVRWVLEFGVVVGDGVGPLTTHDSEDEEAAELGSATENVENVELRGESVNCHASCGGLAKILLAGI